MQTQGLRDVIGVVQRRAKYLGAGPRTRNAWWGSSTGRPDSWGQPMHGVGVLTTRAAACEGTSKVSAICPVRVLAV
jgi:hypothetical protein